MLTGLKAWLWLTDALDCGPAWQVLRHFDTPEQAYFADPAEYELIPKLTPAHRARLRNKSLQRADQILADCDAAGISILTWQDSLYPERLRNIDLPPLVLYWRGTLPRFDEEIAIEWARIPHFYYDYYVFQYATGYAAAIALSRRILSEGEPAVKDYLGFLSGGCSKSPIDLLKGAGVDMTGPQPVNDALALFGELLDEMESLMG